MYIMSRVMQNIGSDISVMFDFLLSAEKKSGGQAGIISCIAMCPTTAGVYALGSYSCSGNMLIANRSSNCVKLRCLRNLLVHLAQATPSLVRCHCAHQRCYLFQTMLSNYPLTSLILR